MRSLIRFISFISLTRFISLDLYVDKYLGSYFPKLG
jgi:hypothetical protein